MTVVVDKLTKLLKNKIMVKYSSVVRKAQKGYPLEDYQCILSAMYSLEYLEQFEISDEDRIRILETHIFSL